MEGSLDAVRYHPLYKGIRPKFDGTEDDPIDLTTTLEDHIFYPPEGEEWISAGQASSIDSDLINKKSLVVMVP